jgi:hypothetical protein
MPKAIGSDEIKHVIIDPDIKNIPLLFFICSLLTPNNCNFYRPSSFDDLVNNFYDHFIEGNHFEILCICIPSSRLTDSLTAHNQLRFSRMLTWDEQKPEVMIDSMFTRGLIDRGTDADTYYELVRPWLNTLAEPVYQVKRRFGISKLASASYFPIAAMAYAWDSFKEECRIEPNQRLYAILNSLRICVEDGITRHCKLKKYMNYGLVEGARFISHMPDPWSWTATKRPLIFAYVTRGSLSSLQLNTNIHLIADKLDADRDKWLPVECLQYYQGISAIVTPDSTSDNQAHNRYKIYILDRGRVSLAGLNMFMYVRRINEKGRVGITSVMDVLELSYNIRRYLAALTRVYILPTPVFTKPFDLYYYKNIPSKPI